MNPCSRLDGLSVVVCLFLLSACVSGGRQDDTLARELLSEGKSLGEDGSYSEAYDKFAAVDELEASGSLRAESGYACLRWAAQAKEPDDVKRCAQKFSRNLGEAADLDAPLPLATLQAYQKDLRSGPDFAWARNNDYLKATMYGVSSALEFWLKQAQLATRWRASKKALLCRPYLRSTLEGNRSGSCLPDKDGLCPHGFVLYVSRPETKPDRCRNEVTN